MRYHGGPSGSVTCQLLFSAHCRAYILCNFGCWWRWFRNVLRRSIRDCAVGSAVAQAAAVVDYEPVDYFVDRLQECPVLQTDTQINKQIQQINLNIKL